MTPKVSSALKRVLTKRLSVTSWEWEQVAFAWEIRDCGAHKIRRGSSVIDHDVLWCLREQFDTGLYADDKPRALLGRRPRTCWTTFLPIECSSHWMASSSHTLMQAWTSLLSSQIFTLLLAWFWPPPNLAPYLLNVTLCLSVIWCRVGCVGLLENDNVEQQVGKP